MAVSATAVAETATNRQGLSAQLSGKPTQVVRAVLVGELQPRHVMECSGNCIGALCDTECSCSSYGTQTNIAAARAAGSCTGGSCSCDRKNVGLQCDGGPSHTL